MEALTHVDEALEPSNEAELPLAKAPMATNAPTTSMLILRGLMIRRLPRRPSPNPLNRGR